MTKVGYKQTPEHVQKRTRRGASHYAWLGSKVSVKGGRSRALRLFKDVGPCVMCGAIRSERHHVDGNTANNEPANVVVVCRRCHMRADGRLDTFKKLAIANQPKAAQARWVGRTNTCARSGDACPLCSKRLSITATRPSGLVYIGCRRFRGGCGYNAGSYRRS